MTTTTAIPPRVWIGCLAAYNGGRLHGRWVDALDLEALEEAERRVIETSPAESAEETYLGDWEGLPFVGEFTPLSVVHALAQAGQEHGTAFRHYVEALGLPVASVEDVERAAEDCAEAMLGEHEGETLAHAVGAYIVEQARELEDLARLEREPWWLVIDEEATGRNYMDTITGTATAPGPWLLFRAVR